MKQLEHEEQTSLMKWWKLFCRSINIHEECLFAIPNGGQRNIITASRLKAEGVRAGIPDLFLAIPNGSFNGLFIEMKKKTGGRVSENQKSMLGILSENGYATKVCHGWLDAKKEIETYIEEIK